MFLEKSQRNLVMYALQKRLLLCPPEKKAGSQLWNQEEKKNEKCYKASLSEREKLISSGITSDFQHLLSSAGTRRVSEPKKGYFQSISDCLILMTHNKPQSQKNRSKLNCLWNQTLTWIDINIHVYVNERRRRQCWKLPFQASRCEREWKCEKELSIFCCSVQQNAGFVGICEAMVPLRIYLPARVLMM